MLFTESSHSHFNHLLYRAILPRAGWRPQQQGYTLYVYGVLITPKIVSPFQNYDTSAKNRFLNAELTRIAPFPVNKMIPKQSAVNISTGKALNENTILVTNPAKHVAIKTNSPVTIVNFNGIIISFPMCSIITSYELCVRFSPTLPVLNSSTVRPACQIKYRNIPSNNTKQVKSTPKKYGNILFISVTSKPSLCANNVETTYPKLTVNLMF